MTCSSCFFFVFFQGMKATTRHLCPGGFETAAAASPACRTRVTRVSQRSQSNFLLRRIFCRFLHISNVDDLIEFGSFIHTSETMSEETMDKSARHRAACLHLTRLTQCDESSTFETDEKDWKGHETHEWLMNDPWMTHEWLMNDSWMTHEWLMNDSWMTHEWLMNDSWMTHEWLMNDSWMTNEWLMNDSWMTHESLLVSDLRTLARPSEGHCQLLWKTRPLQHLSNPHSVRHRPSHKAWQVAWHRNVQIRKKSGMKIEKIIEIEKKWYTDDTRKDSVDWIF